MTDNLLERAARAVQAQAANGDDCPDDYPDAEGLARAVLAIAFEEAAHMADTDQTIYGANAGRLNSACAHAIEILAKRLRAKAKEYTP